MANDSKPTRLVSIDALRGFAVLAVVMSHLPFSARGLGGTEAGAIFPAQPIPEILDYGRLGVQLFLIISGFCIHLRWARNANRGETVDFLPFWRRRLARLYPPYFVTLIGALIATFVFHSVLGQPGAGIAGAFGYTSSTTFALDMVLLVFMLQNLTPAAWRVNNGPFWSLALEEQLYMLYFPLLWMRRNWGWGQTFLVVTIATITWRVLGVAIFEKPPFFWYIVGPAFWLPWAAGAYAVEVYFGHQKQPRGATSLVLGVLLFGAGVLCDPPEFLGVARTVVGRVFDDLMFSAACFVLLSAAVQREASGKLRGGLALEMLTKIGVWSYSIYLVHLLVMVPVKQALVMLGMPDVVILVLRLGSGLVAGYIFFRIVERPFHGFARRFKARMKEVPVKGGDV